MAGLKEAEPDKAASLNWTETSLVVDYFSTMPDKAASLNWTETFKGGKNERSQPDKAASLNWTETIAALTSRIARA